MPTPTTPRVTRYTWAAGTTNETPGVLIDVPGTRARGAFVSLDHLATFIDELEDIENSH